MDPTGTSEPRVAAVLEVAELDALLRGLVADGYALVGPTVRQNAIVYAPIDGIEDLPRGLTDTQAPGEYRLHAGADDALFGFASGQGSLKEIFFPSREPLVRLRKKGERLDAGSAVSSPRPVALIGARSCDLHGVEVQDRILNGGFYRDPAYAGRREGAFVVAVQCAHAGGTCFCASMGTGPRAEGGFDLALTELTAGGAHRFVVEVGSERGAAVLARIPRRAPTEEEARAPHEVPARTAERMGRRMETEGIKALLYDNLEHPRWDDVASRCLACTNCTLVCPTCFCSEVREENDPPAAAPAEARTRERVWDSCFTAGHSYVHGGLVRPSIRARYRQWLVHKLASWIDQFGESGCVGCGRCITFCPVGIDITEEVAAIRAAPGAGRA